MTNLIVNYLPQNMSQDEIKALFGSVGEMESCKLIKDKATGQSLGYGFVNYKNAFDARKALETFNGLRLQNKRIKVSIARPSSSLIKGANLYVGGIPKWMQEADLRKMFAPCGNIITLRILLDPKTDKSRGVGFVRFDTRLEADTAIKQLNGLLLAGCFEPLVVKFANHPTSESMEESCLEQAISPLEKTTEHSLVVENLAAEMDEVDVWQLFGPYGAVKGVRMLDSDPKGKSQVTDNFSLQQKGHQQHKRQHQQQRGKRSAIVRMGNYHNAMVAVACLNGVFVRGTKLQVLFKKAPLDDFTSFHHHTNTSFNHSDSGCNDSYNSLNDSFNNFNNNHVFAESCYNSYNASFISNNSASFYYDNGAFQEVFSHYKNNTA